VVQDRDVDDRGIDLDPEVAQPLTSITRPVWPTSEHEIGGHRLLHAIT
jgi:hypothetical protein